MAAGGLRAVSLLLLLCSVFLSVPSVSWTSVRVSLLLLLQENLLFQLLWFLCASFSSCLFLFFNRWMSSLQKYSFRKCLIFPLEFIPQHYFNFGSSKSYTVNKVFFYFIILDFFSHISSTHVLISSLIFLLVPSAVMGVSLLLLASPSPEDGQSPRGGWAAAETSSGCRASFLRLEVVFVSDNCLTNNILMGFGWNWENPEPPVSLCAERCLVRVHFLIAVQRWCV